MRFKDLPVSNSKEFGEEYRDQLVKIAEDKGLQYTGYACGAEDVDIEGVDKKGNQQLVRLPYDKFFNYFPLSSKEIDVLVEGKLIERKVSFFKEVDMSIIQEFQEEYDHLNYDNSVLVDIVKSKVEEN